MFFSSEIFRSVETEVYNSDVMWVFVVIGYSSPMKLIYLIKKTTTKQRLKIGEGVKPGGCL